MADYNNIPEMLATTSNMTVLVNNSKNDDNTVTVTGVDWFKFKNVVATNIYVSGNGWMGFGASSEQLKVNRRDQAMWYLWREEATVGEGLYKVLRLRWRGYTAYSSTSSSALLIYDCIIMDNGRIFLNIDTWPTSNLSGVNQLIANSTVSFSPSQTAKQFTFLPQDETNSTYTVVSGLDEPDYIQTRYLISDNTGAIYYPTTDAEAGGIETSVEGTWLLAIPDATQNTLTSELFMEYGVNQLNGELLLQLTDPTIIKWEDRRQPILDVAYTGTHKPSQISVVADLTSPAITGISELEAIYTGDVAVQYSYDGTNYVAAQSIEAFLQTDLAALYSGMSVARRIWFIFELSGAATLTNFVMKYQ